MAKTDERENILMVTFLKNPRESNLMISAICNMESEEGKNMDWTTSKKQEQTTTKNIAKNRVHTNKLHANILYAGK